MKRLVITAIVIATFAASSAALADPPWARGGDRDFGYFAHARVTSVQPILRPVYQRQRVCQAYPVGARVAPDPRRAAGTLLGAVIGGALGNTIGKGDGRVAATVAGAVIGGAIGNRAAAGDEDRAYAHARVAYQRRCAVRPVFAGRRVVAYAVTYRFHGRHFRARMDHDPGWRVRVHVGREVRLAE